MHIKIGEWLAYSSGYVYWERDDKATFPTKKEAIEHVSSMRLDARPTPRIKRVCKGCYIYTPKDCDTGEYSEEFYIERVTPKNHDEFKELVDGQIDEDPL